MIPYGLREPQRNHLIYVYNLSRIKSYYNLVSDLGAEPSKFQETPKGKSLVTQKRGKKIL